MLRKFQLRSSCTNHQFCLFVLIQSQTGYFQGVAEEMHPLSYHVLSGLYIFSPSELGQIPKAKLHPERTFPLFYVRTHTE